MRIVYATDLSPEALAGAYLSFSLAEFYRGSDQSVKLDILHVIEESGVAGRLLGGGDVDTQALEKSVRNWVDDNIEDATPFELTVCQGKPVDEVRQFVDDQNTDLLVMGQSGKGTFTRMVLGSTAHRISQNPPCNLIFAHREFSAFGRPRKFAVGVDFNEPSEHALRETAALARAVDAELDIVHVFDPPKPPAFPGGIGGYDATPEELEELRRDADQKMSDFVDAHRHELDGLTTRAQVLSGSPTHQLVEYAVTKTVDLISLGTVGKTSIDRAVLGSVAGGVSRHMPASTLLVPPIARKS